MTTLTIPNDSIVVRPQRTRYITMDIDDDITEASYMIRTNEVLVKEIKVLGPGRFFDNVNNCECSPLTISTINEPKDYQVGYMLRSRLEMDITKENGSGIYLAIDKKSALRGDYF